MEQAERERSWALASARAEGVSKTPDGDDDAELDGRELIADRLVDEVGWLRQRAGWLTRLHAGDFQSARLLAITGTG
jgi:hypothetical protein